MTDIPRDLEAEPTAPPLPAAAEAPPAVDGAAPAAPPPGPSVEEVPPGAAGDGDEDQDEAAEPAPAPVQGVPGAEERVRLIIKPGAPEGDGAAAGSRREERAQFAFNELKPETLEKVDSVFVEPPGFRRPGDRDFRVCVLHGPERSGRFTCAVKFGLGLLGGRERRCRHYRPGRGAARSLFDLQQGIALAEKTVVVIENVFDDGVAPDDFSDRNIEWLNAELAEKDSVLVLTTAVPHTPLFERKLHSFTLGTPDVDKVFEAHLAWYTSSKAGLTIAEGVQVLTRSLWERVRGWFRTPVQVDDYCIRLSKLRPRPGPEGENEVEQVARDVTRVDPFVARQWFADLAGPLNARLLALLVVLFRGQPRPWVEDLYARQAKRLRAEGLPFDDPWAVGMEDLYERLRVRTGEGGELQFVDWTFEQEVEKQLDNYYHLLWSVMDAITEILRVPFLSIDREGLGWAIGRLGTHSPAQMHQCLEGLASEYAVEVASVAGHALRQVCLEKDPDYECVLAEVARWVDSEDPNRTWSAAFALGRVYPTLLQRLPRGDGGPPAVAQARDPRWAAGEARRLLDRLAGRFDVFHRRAFEAVLARFQPPRQSGRSPVNTLDELGQFSPQDQQPYVEFLGRAQEGWANDNRTAVVRVLLETYRVRPAVAIDVVREWLRPEDEPAEAPPAPQGAGETPVPGTAGGGELRPDPAEQKQERQRRRDLGHTALDRLFQAHQDPGRLQPRDEALLELLPFLFDAEQGRVETILNILLGWLEKGEWRAPVRRALLRAVDHSRPDQRLLLYRGLLHTWLESEGPEIRGLAASLFARARALDGAPCDLPGHGTGLLLLDGSRAARTNDTAARTALDFHQRLCCQLDVRVGHLGTAHRPEATPGDIVLGALRPGHDLPRLVAPLLEREAPARVPFVLIITWGGLLDFEDVADGEWGERLLLLDVRGNLAPESPGDEDWLEELLEGPDAADRQLTQAVEVYRALKGLRESATRRTNQSLVETAFAGVEAPLNRLLGRHLARRASKAWQEGLSGLTLGAWPASPGEQSEWLDHRARDLDAAGSDEGPCDAARVLACGLLCLAATDLRAAVERLLGWLATGNDDPRHTLGLGGALQLLRVHVDSWRGVREPRRAPLPATPYAALLDLAPALAAERQLEALGLVLDLLRWHAARPDWEDLLRPGPASRLRPLHEMMRLLPGDVREPVSERLRAWEEPLGWLGEEAAPAAARRLADRLRLRWRERRPLPPLADGESYGVLVVQAPRPGTRPSRKTLDRLVRKLWREAPRRLPGRRLVAFVAGQVFPHALPGEEPKTFVPPEAPAPLPLLAPLLEALPYHQVGFVLLLGGRPFLDQDDWERAWQRKGFVYGDAAGERPEWAPPWEFVAGQADLNEAVEAILAPLTRLRR